MSEERKRVRALVAILVGLLVVVGTAYGPGLWAVRAWVDWRSFRGAQEAARAAGTDNAEVVRAFGRYVVEHPDGRYVEDALSKIGAVLRGIQREARQYEDAKRYREAAQAWQHLGEAVPDEVSGHQDAMAAAEGACANAEACRRLGRGELVTAVLELQATETVIAQGGNATLTGAVYNNLRWPVEGVEVHVALDRTPGGMAPPELIRELYFRSQGLPPTPTYGHKSVVIADALRGTSLAGRSRKSVSVGIMLPRGSSAFTRDVFVPGAGAEQPPFPLRWRVSEVWVRRVRELPQ